MGKDFYNLLGVSKKASTDEIKKGYRKMAVKWHPDKHSNSSDAERAAAEEKFKDVAQAYEVLSDPQQRTVYDQYGEEGLKAGAGNGPTNGAAGAGMGGMSGFPGGASGFPGGVRVVFSSNGSGLGGMSNSHADDIFRAFFGNSDPFGGQGSFGDDGLSSAFHGLNLGSMQGSRRGPSMRSRSRRSQRERCDQLPCGAAVRLAGLENASLNGARGEIVDFNEEKQRYKVKLHSGSAAVAIKPSNLQQLLNGIEVVGTSRQDLNGRIGAHAYYDCEKGRYIIDGLGSNTISLRPENVKLPASTRVAIEGMQNRKDLNGVIGKVVSADDERYTMQLQTGEQVRVRLDAVTSSLAPSL